MPTYFCTTEPFTDQVRGQLPRWPETPSRPITWHCLSDLPGIPAGAFRPTIAYALECFPQVCGLSFAWTDDPSLANILLAPAPIGTPSFGRPGGVLADSELPINLRNNNVTLRQRYDSERWSSEDYPQQSNKISLPTVARHELMHAFGLPHTNVPDQLMNPSLNPRIAFPQDDDIKQLVLRYGPRLVDQPPTNPQPNPQPNPNQPFPSGTRYAFKAHDAAGKPVFDLAYAGDILIYRNGKLQTLSDSPFQQ